MADILKVFKNGNVELAATGDATSIAIYTTAADETIVLKDVQLEITELEAGDEGFYIYPTTLQVNGVKQGPAVNLAGASRASLPLSMTGSQIVGPNSVVTLEIEAEAALTNFGSADVAYHEDNTAVKIGSYNMSSTSPAKTGATSILDQVLSSAITASGAQSTNGYSGTVITSGGVKKFGYTDGSRLNILDINGAQLDRWNFSVTSYCCAADDTYFYMKPSSTQAYLKRYNHVTMSSADNLDLTGTQSSYGQSNKGWVDIYNGVFYYRPLGNSATTRMINLTTGATTYANIGGVSQSEFLGGIINTNVNGLTLAVMHGDNNMSVCDVDSSSSNYLSNNNQSSAFPTDPTTTNGNTVLSLAPGVIWVNNGSYDQNLIIDTNSMSTINDTYTQTVTSSAVQLGSSDKVFIGAHHQSVSAKTRKMSYRVTASGIKST